MLADLSEGTRLGPQLAMFRVTGDTALLVAPLVTGVLYETSGRSAASIPLIIFVAAVAALATVVLPDTRADARPASAQHG